MYLAHISCKVEPDNLEFRTRIRGSTGCWVPNATSYLCVANTIKNIAWMECVQKSHRHDVGQSTKSTLQFDEDKCRSSDILPTWMSRARRKDACLLRRSVWQNLTIGCPYADTMRVKRILDSLGMWRTLQMLNDELHVEERRPWTPFQSHLQPTAQRAT